ncbi:MAG: 50S ribosomal protein L3, partial [Planctomycetota bacterium]|nr:50S ribosomal protein L3 [Planctomycetota bacterium]
FSRCPKTHGSQSERRSGAIGASALPGRVWPGKKMAGHSGVRRVTVKNLKIVDIIPEENLLVVKGAVPGPNGGFVEVLQSSIG